MITNNEISEKFEQTANILELLDENLYRIRAYRNAARSILNWPQNLSQIVLDKKDLTIIPGVGKDLVQKIITLVKTGEFPLLNQLHQKVPKELCLLLKIPGLGPKRIARLNKQLKINSFEDLKKALIEKKIQSVPGFGLKSEEKIYKEVLHFQKTKKR